MTIPQILCFLTLSTFVAASYPTHGVLKNARGFIDDSTHFSGQRRDGYPLGSRDLPEGTCDSNTPCPNGACCGSDNLCGYSPNKECGPGCHSNCNAKAECGPYALPATANCPLDVCCSEFGFCGSTDEFCTWTNPTDPDYPKCDTKYGGCGAVDRPSCSGTGSVSKRTIGYYETWSNSRTTSPVAPEDLNLDGFTHINFAFSFFDPSTLEITSMDSNAAALYQRFTKLKDTKSGLQAWISVGGWSFTDPGATQQAFSNMVSTSGNRAKFINNLKQFMDTYGFDGVDLDWEYPGADDRGGVTADTENYVAFVQDLRSGLGSKYGISMTLPTSYWYLQHFDLSGIQQHIDWFNLMSYDLHGVWDKISKFVGPYIRPHTNITEIDAGLDLLWRAGVKPENVILGQAWYGRSFTLSDPSCNLPNGVCQFSDAAKAGPISNAAGILIDQEISEIIKTNNLSPTWDKTAGVKWITWDSNQWVSYDDSDTFQQKRDFAGSRCLGGLMVWAMDQVDQTSSNGNSPGGGDVSTDDQNNAQQMSADQQAKLNCRTTDCGQSCAKGTTEVTETSGQPGDLSTSARCPTKQYRSVCCNSGTTLGTCQWRGYRGAGLSCVGGCADGETEVATANNNHDKKKGDQNCNGGLQSFCCAGFKAPPSKAQLEQEAEDAAKAAAEAAAAQAALDLAAKAFCRVAVPALLAPLELLEDIIPFVGEILDIAEIAATPALINVCVKGVEKEGKAEFKVFGKEHTLSMDKPTTKPPETRPPTSSHEPPKTSSEDPDSCKAKRALGERAPGCNRITKTDYTAMTTVYHTIEKVCDGGEWPQACMHYSSVIRVYNDPRFNPVTCSSNARPREFIGADALDATAVWSRQHNTGWRNWMRRNQLRCQRDEWPPAHFWQGDLGEIIRYNHLEDNTGAGGLWRSFCPEHAPTACEAGSEHLIDDPARRSATLQCKKSVDINVMRMVFDMDAVPLSQRADDGLQANECYPLALVNDPTFAILNEDRYFALHGRAPNPLWANAPTPALTAGQTPPFRKRSSMYLESEFAVDTGNATRRLTPGELDQVAQYVEFEEHLRMLDEQMKSAYVDCRGDSCATELSGVGNSVVLLLPERTNSPSTVEATVTASTISPSATFEPVAALRGRILAPNLPVATARS